MSAQALRLDKPLHRFTRLGSIKDIMKFLIKPCISLTIGPHRLQVNDNSAAPLISVKGKRTFQVVGEFTFVTRSVEAAHK